MSEYLRGLISVFGQYAIDDIEVGDQILLRRALGGIGMKELLALADDRSYATDYNLVKKCKRWLENLATLHGDHKTQVTACLRTLNKAREEGGRMNCLRTVN